MLTWKRILRAVKYRISSVFFSPVMKRIEKFNGENLVNTRVSNTTFIYGQENIVLGNHVYIGHYCFIEGSNGLVIEEGVQITNYVNITTHSSHISIRLYGQHYSDFKELIGYQKGSIRIGAYTFIGPFTVIMPGTQIGKGCIVKAYSYLRGVFPDFSIIEGNPARRVGDTREVDKPYLERFSELKQFYEAWAGKHNE